jgi:protein gp37
MGDKTRIEWTDATWNPITGCDKVSPGCAHCYAERVAIRLWPSQYPQVMDRKEFGRGELEEFVRPREFGDVQCHEKRLDQPLRWKKPRKIFVNSMSDLFHEAVPDAFIDRVFAVMALAPQHTFQILTKRAERMYSYMTRQNARGFSRESNINGAIWSLLGTQRGSKIHHGGNWRAKWPMPNVWLGVSVENQHFADERIPLLLQTAAAVRFISAEPLLGSLDLNALPDPKGDPSWDASALHGVRECAFGSSVSRETIARLDLVIVGGESGRDARPCDRRWIYNLIDQCRGAGVPIFVKQLGAFSIIDGITRTAITDRDARLPLLDSHGGDPDEWPEDLRIRQLPPTAASSTTNPTTAPAMVTSGRRP